MYPDYTTETGYTVTLRTYGNRAFDVLDTDGDTVESFLVDSNGDSVARELAIDYAETL